jgi:hypothetical protein
MKVQLKATELVNPNVKRVAMVKRGANQLPFRLTKGENGMLDLTKLASAFNLIKDDGKPAVYAVVVRKDADMEAIKARLTKAGIDLTSQTEKDGLVVFAQKEVKDTDLGLIKIDNDVGVLISNITKAFVGYTFEGTSFEETMKTNGFYPSMRLACEAMQDTVYGIMQKAESPSDAATAISKVVDEYKAYVTSLASGIPEQAFKIDTGYAEEDEKDKKKKKKVTKDEAEGDPKPAPTPPTPNPNPSPNPNPPVPDPIKKDDAVAGDPPIVPAAVANNTELLAGLKAIVEGAVTGLRKEVTDMGADIRKDVNGLNLRVSQVADQVKKTEEAVHGTVVADPAGDKTGLKKTGGDNVRRLPVPPLLDTGTMDLKKHETEYEEGVKKAFG